MFGRPIDERACQVKGVFVERARRARADERALVARSGSAFSPAWSRSASARRDDATWVTWPCRRHPPARDGALRPDARARRGSAARHERHARVARHLLPGPPAGAALHVLARRHPQRRVPEPRRVRGSDARRAVVPVLQQEPAQHRGEPARAGAGASIPTPARAGAAAAVRAIGDRGPALRSHGAADRGDRVVLRPEGHLQAARGGRLRGARRSSRRPRSGAGPRAATDRAPRRRPTRSSR